jgi:hypothetical protein
MATQIDRNATIATVNTTTVNRREAAATNIAARHLANRDERHITARQVRGMLVWTVQSQTGDEKYTVTIEELGASYTTCNCRDFQYRGVTCKHIKSVKLLAGVSEPKPASVVRTSRREAWDEECDL